MPAVFGGLRAPGVEDFCGKGDTPLAVNFRQKQQKQRKLGSPDGVLERLRCRGRGVGAAGRAFRVLADADRVKAGAQRIVEQQRAVEAVAECQQFLQDLDCLQGAENASDGAEDAGGLAARDEVGGRRLAEEAAVAGMARPEIGPEGRDLASKGDNAAATSGFSRRQQRSVKRYRVAKLSLPSATRS